CIPTKSMIKPVETIWSLSKMNFIKLNYEIDFESYMDWVNSISSKVSEGVAGLLRGYNVDVYDARASVAGDGLVELSEGRVLKAGKIVVSTGTDPAAPPNIEFDGVLIHNNRTILGLRRKPSRVVIVGAGYIGVEFANVMAKVGVEVHLVEALDRVLPMMEEDFSKLLSRRLSKLGIKAYTSTRVEEVSNRESYVKVKLSNGAELEADHMLVAVGRKPNTRGIGLEKAGVELDERGYIKVDESMRTSNPSIYAAGDSTGPPLLAHKAFLQAIVAAETAAGLKSFYDPRAVPSIVFTDPEMVSVGLTEAEARKAGYNVGVTKLPLGGLARALIEDSLDGFIKIVYDDSTKTILGIHIAGPHASELAGEAALAIEMGATLEDLALTVHPHPTISEAIQEAAELALGKPKHFILRKKRF
ncbi:MAG: dihydrolipoyl dehydrogenase, partial [Acidilobaceae archaeon]